MKLLVEPVILAPLSSECSDGPDEEGEKVLGTLSTEEATELVASVLNEDGIVNEFHAPRLVVKET
jgi:hypothetical protein